MCSLVGMMLFFLMVVSGDDNVSNVTGFVGDDVLLPCNCSDRDSDKEFRWQAEGNEDVLVVKHNGNTSNFTGDYKDRAELFPSKDKSNCSLLLKNIKLEDEGKYKCSFKSGGSHHHFSYVNLTVSKRAGFLPSPGPKEPKSRANIQTLWPVMPVALVAVFSLFLFFLY